MSLKEWFLKLFARGMVVEEPPLTPLEYLEQLLPKVDSDLDQPYVRISMYMTISTRFSDIYEMIGVIDDCSTNIRQKTTLPKEATRTPPNVQVQDTLLREFVVDLEGRSLGREACFRSLIQSTQKLLRELKREHLGEYEYRHYVLKLEFMVNEITLVLDTYLNDDGVGG